MPTEGVSWGLGSAGATDALADYAVQQLGGIDIWINNAGPLPPVSHTSATLPPLSLLDLLLSRPLSAHHSLLAPTSSASYLHRPCTPAWRYSPSLLPLPPQPFYLLAPCPLITRSCPPLAPSNPCIDRAHLFGALLRTCRHGANTAMHVDFSGGPSKRRHRPGFSVCWGLPLSCPPSLLPANFARSTGQLITNETCW